MGDSNSERFQHEKLGGKITIKQLVDFNQEIWMIVFNLQVYKTSAQTSTHGLIIPLVIAELLDYYATKNG